MSTFTQQPSGVYLFDNPGSSSNDVLPANFQRLADLWGDMSVTVGSAGDYETIADALATVSQARSATVNILTGHTVSDQINIVQGESLAHVKITSADATVSVNTTGFSSADDDRGSVPLFNIQNGARGPLIDCIFVQTTGPQSSGMVVNRGSLGMIGTSGGFRDFHDGVIVNNASTLQARSGEITGTTRWGVHARHMSFACLTLADISGNAGTGVFALRSSLIDVRGADCSDCDIGVDVVHGSVCEAHGLIANGCTTAGLQIRFGANCNGRDADLKNCGNAIIATNGGLGDITDGDMDQSGNVLVQTGSRLSLHGNANFPGTTIDAHSSVHGQGAGVGSINVLGDVIFADLPTTDPNVAGQLWLDSGTLTVSSG